MENNPNNPNTLKNSSNEANQNSSTYYQNPPNNVKTESNVSNPAQQPASNQKSTNPFEEYLSDGSHFAAVNLNNVPNNNLQFQDVGKAPIQQQTVPQGQYIYNPVNQVLPNMNTQSVNTATQNTAFYNTAQGSNQLQANVAPQESNTTQPITQNSMNTYANPPNNIMASTPNNIQNSFQIQNDLKNSNSIQSSYYQPPVNTQMNSQSETSAINNSNTHAYGYGGAVQNNNINASTVSGNNVPSTVISSGTNAVNLQPEPLSNFSQNLNPSNGYTPSTPAYALGYGNNPNISVPTNTTISSNISSSNIDAQSVASGISSMTIAPPVVNPANTVNTKINNVSSNSNQFLESAQNTNQFYATGYGNIAPQTNTQANAQINNYGINTNPILPPPKSIYGPVVQFLTTDLVKAEWVGTILTLTDSSVYKNDIGPCIHIWQDKNKISDIRAAEKYTAKLLFDDTTNGFKFWVVNLRLPLPALEESQVHYQAIHPNGSQTYASAMANFTLPSQKTSWRWFCFSNDDLSYISEAKIKSTRLTGSLWSDLVEKHKILPFHAVLGTGGQINGDRIWQDLGLGYTSSNFQIPEPYNSNKTGQAPYSSYNDNSVGALAPFVGMCTSTGVKYTTNECRKNIPWNTTMEEAVSRWYFTRYMQRWFNSEQHGYETSKNEQNMSSVLHTIPYMFCLDENDIFPGYGSFTNDLMNSPVFRGIYSVALKYWSLFQAHTTWTAIQTNRVQDNIFVSALGLHWIRSLGPYVSILGLDITSEKNKKQVMSQYAYEDIFRAINTRVLSLNQHLIIASPIPVLYSHTMFLDNILSGAKNIGIMGFVNYAQKKLSVPSYGQNMPDPTNYKDKITEETIGAAANSSVDYLGENITLLNLNTLWTSGSHMSERNSFIIKLQQLTNNRVNLRVSFISGHVNCCTAGRFISVENTYPQSEVDHNENFDNRLMIQLVTSSMSDIPIDNTSLKGLYLSGKTKSLDDYTLEKFYKMFKLDVDNKPPVNGNRKILARRSFITIEHVTVFTDMDYSTQANVVPVTSLRANMYCEGIRSPAIVDSTNSGFIYNTQNTLSTSAQQDPIKTTNYSINIPNLNLYNKPYFANQFNSTYNFPQSNVPGGFSSPVLPTRVSNYSQPTYPVLNPPQTNIAQGQQGSALTNPITEQIPNEPPPPYTPMS
ncbi:hypothetical protein BB561_005215 [Smittium simulii]|uniref:PhoD-like phosphatase domain-containing protein n=1 Tax=Smittium simulii TaxID=133385 RepID=A0A2T9YBM8_9FUNG|nr:hypothetical protein BB561_005215 [Smittium simulii]